MTARVQDAGLARITTALAVLPWWMQLGSGAGAGQADNDVADPVEARASASAVPSTKNVAGDTLTVTGTVFATADVVIREIGVFDQASGGDMAFYIEVADVSLSPGSAYALTLTLRFG